MGVTVDARLHVWLICFRSCSNFAHSFLRLDAWIFSVSHTVMKYRFVSDMLNHLLQQFPSAYSK